MKSFAVALCAPSGTGKTTVARALVAASDDLVFSISVTTRPARRGERDGVDYRFVSRERFEAMVADGAMLEWAKVHGELYGTPRSNLEEAEKRGRVLILDIDVQGAEQAVRARPDTVTIFLLPPSAGALLERLRDRGSEDPGTLATRLETAQRELEVVDRFDYVVVNERVDDAVGAVRSIIAAERSRLSRQAAEIAALRASLKSGLESAGH